MLCPVFYEMTPLFWEFLTAKRRGKLSEQVAFSSSVGPVAKSTLSIMSQDSKVWHS